MSVYVLLVIVLYIIGVLGILITRKNILLVLMSIELMLLAINLNFIVNSIFLDDIVGQVFSLFVLTVAAAESAIGLAILVIFYRLRGEVIINKINKLKG